MAQNYVVTYTINVAGVEAAETNINKFVNAVNRLNSATEPFRKLNERLAALKTNLSEVTQASYKIRVNTLDAEKSLDRLINKLRTLKRLAVEANNLGVLRANRTANNSGGNGNGGNNSGNTAGVVTRNNGGNSNRASGSGGSGGSGGNRGGSARGGFIASHIPRNITYRALGPTPVNGSGLVGVDILKGMGIAYGMSAIGSAVSRIGQDAAAYDNAMQTVRNILASHDKSTGFDSTFSSMERIVRNVGVETKFTAPEVADAAKFLAMAGFDVRGISRSIRPIADIALVGDTDLGETADVVTNIMTGYGIAPERLKNAADVMTMTFTKSNTTLMEMAEAYKYSASLLALNGTSFEEATAALGILGDAGIKGSQAGTTMRTIALNIAKPTKQQAAMWDALGVRRLDSNGNVRDLYAIFKDLHEKNLSVAQLGRLFHKTATMGAGVLAANVDKWNEVIELNFLSEGMASQLAEQKKNTISGLWAQLTSMFTEDGIQAFEGIQGPIKDFLRSITEWLKTPEAANGFKKLATSVMEFADIIKTSTGYLLTFIKHTWWLIKPWMQLQLAIWPVTAAFKAFLGLKAGLLGLFHMTGWITKLAGALKGLRLSILATNAAAGTSGFWNFFRTGTAQAKGALSTYYRDSFQNGMSGFYPNAVTSTTAGAGGPVVWPGPEPTGNSRGSWPRWIAGSVVSMGVGLGGALLGSMLGGQIGGLFDGENSNTGSSLGSLIGGAVGGIGLSVFTGKIGALASLLGTMPVMAFGAAAGLGYVAYKAIEYVQSIKQAIEANADYLSSLASINGINYSEHATKADKYYAIIYNRQLDVNQAINEHIKLIREELGLIDDVVNKVDNGKKYKEVQKEIYDKLADPYGSWWRSGSYSEAAATKHIDGLEDPVRTMVGLTEYWKFGDKLYGDDSGSLRQLGARRFLIQQGSTTIEGSTTRKIIDEYFIKFLRARNMSDFNKYATDLNSYLDSMTHIPGSETWDVYDIGRHTQAEVEKSYSFLEEGLKPTVRSHFDIENPNTPNAKLLKSYAEILEKLDNKQEVPQELLIKFLWQSGIDAFDESRYGKFGTDEWLAHFGFTNGKWEPWQYYDEQGHQRALSLEQTMQKFTMVGEQTQQFISKLSPDIQSLFSIFANNRVWELGQAGREGTGRSQEGQLYNDNGRYYRYENGFWYEADSNGNIPTRFGPKVADSVFRRAHGMDSDDGGVDSNGLNTNLTPGLTDYNSDYKSNYRSNSAAPKQVIVNIENLMNVESVDLSNPENRTAVNNLKDQLAQALIDVVHDFDETWS